MKKNLFLFLTCFLITEAHATLSQGLDLFEAGKYQDSANVFCSLHNAGAIIPIAYLDYIKKKNLAVVEIELPQIPLGEQIKCQQYLDCSLAYQSILAKNDVNGSLRRLVELNAKGHYRAHLLLNKALASDIPSQKIKKEMSRKPFPAVMNILDCCYDGYTLGEHYKLPKISKDVLPGSEHFSICHTTSAKKDADSALKIAKLLLDKNDEKYAYKWFRVALENGHYEAPYYLLKLRFPKGMDDVETSNAAFLADQARDAIEGEAEDIGKKAKDKLSKQLKLKRDLTPQEREFLSVIQYLARKIPDTSSINANEIGRIFCAVAGLCKYLGVKGEETHEYNRKGADRGFFYAQLECGQDFFAGYGCEKDWEKALGYLKMANEQGCLRSRALMALIKDAQGTTQSLKEARELYKDLVVKGHIPSLVQYGELLLQGLGGPANPAEALECFLKAAEKGDRRGESVAAEILYFGLAGADFVDKPKAQGLCKRAADKGCADALFMYAIMLHNDLKGSRKNIFNHVRSSADKGNKQAQYYVAQMLEIGDGIERDVDEARKYLKKSAAQGYQDAIVLLHQLENKDSQEDTKNTEHSYTEINIELPEDAEEDTDEETISEDTSLSSTSSTSSTSSSTATTSETHTTLSTAHVPDDSPEKQEIDHYMKLYEREVDELKTKKKLSLRAKKEEYQVVEPKLVAFEEPQIYTVKCPETIEFVNAVFSVGDRKITDFDMKTTMQALIDLGCELDNSKGQNAIEITCHLKKDRTLKYGVEDQKEKYTLHTTHGGKENNLYITSKRHLKHFLTVTGRVPGSVVCRRQMPSDKAGE